MTPDRFTLSIELGNESMQSPQHVAKALHTAANRLDAYAERYGADILAEHEVIHSIRDDNGNLVGQWRFT